jgi:hypothetical protein
MTILTLTAEQAGLLLHLASSPLAARLESAFRDPGKEDAVMCFAPGETQELKRLVRRLDASLRPVKALAKAMGVSVDSRRDMAARQGEWQRIWAEGQMVGKQQQQGER